MLLVAAIATSCRYLIGDSVVQVCSDEPYDIRRAITFGIFGFAYASTIGHVFYNKIYAQSCFQGRPLLTAMFDVSFNCPFFYFPSFYIAQETVYTPVNEVLADPITVAKNGVSRYSGNFWEDAKICAQVWIPLHYVNFLFVPLHLRMTFIAVAGSVWAGVLSAVRGDDKAKALEAEEERAAQ